MNDDAGEHRHAIGAVESRTGLSAHTIRAWEKRYGAVEPARTEGGHRLYSEAQVRRLRLLHELTEHGHRIGSVAALPTEELGSLLESTRRDVGELPPEVPGEREPDEGRIRELMAAVRELDAERLDAAFRRTALERSAHDLIEDVISPLLRRIGEAWERGDVSPAEEHLASGVVTRTLAWVLDAFQAEPDAPLAVAATPTGQRHGLGALLAAATAAARGWRIAYLGPDLPGEEIADAARTTGADAVILSLVYPASDAALGGELRALRAGLPEGTSLLVGGAGAASYAEALEEVDARVLAGYDELRRELDVLAAP